MSHRSHDSGRILVVDDDIPFRRSLAIALRLEGVDVCEAASRAEALVTLAGRAIVLAMVNQHLEAGRGAELLEEIGRLSPVTLLVAVTCQQGLALSAPLTGRAIQLVKPIAPDQILQLLQ